MHIERVDLADAEAIRACHAVSLAADHADDPQGPWVTERPFSGWMTVGWGGEPREAWLVRDQAVGASGGMRTGPAGRVNGWYRLELPARENRDRAYLDVIVRPQERRRGLGLALLRHAAGRAAAHGRAVISGTARNGTPGEAFARSAGAEPGVVEVRRVLELGTLADGRLARLREQAEQAAAGYSLVSWTGPVPEEFIERAAALYAALSDAPHDPGEAPEEWDARRVREANDRRPCYGVRDYSVAALTRGGAQGGAGGEARGGATGELAALTDMIVDPADPGWGHQAITAVTREHRGHRLGLLVKVAMLELLAAAEPQLERIETWNGEANGHMIAINQALGFTISGTSATSWRLDAAAVPGGPATDQLELAGPGGPG